MISIRKIGVIGRTYRNLNRYRQILTVFFKYGFGDLVDHLKIEQYIEIGLQMVSRKRRERVERFSRAERVRMALEELGPTYIKLGQILSTRPDLVPADFVRELAKLQDKVPAYPFVEFTRILETHLGGSIDTDFASLDETPLASASIGQVHRGQLVSGDEVAIKIQRPGIRSTVEVDLEIMLHLATLMERHIEEIALHRPVKIVEEFARLVSRELDYTIEATSMERVAAQFLDNPRVYIPKVYRRLSADRVLVTEFVEGIKVSHLDRLQEADLKPAVVCDRGADILLSQIFEFGFFHADPHPGNIFVLPDNVICLIDFGMMGSVDRATREDFVELVDAIVRRDEQRAMRVLLKLTLWEEEPDVRRLGQEVADFMGQHLYRPLEEIELGRLLHHLLDLVGRHQLRLPPEIFLMLKALTIVEGVARNLNPEFDMIAKAEPFVRSVKLARFSAERVSSDIVAIVSQAFEFANDFPKDLLEITRSIRQKKLTVQLEMRGLEKMLHTHDQISNRISFAIIIAALIIGSALIVISKTPPIFYGISLIGIIGFVAAAVMGIWLLVAIIKKGKL